MPKVYICDKNKNTIYGYVNPSSLDGFRIKPRNNVKYDGIEVSKLTLLNPGFIERVLKKKTHKQLNAYLNFLIDVADDESGNSGALQIVLGDVQKYKNMIINKYAKFLPPRQIKEILLRVKFVEDELKEKIKENRLYYSATREYSSRRR